MLMRRDGTLTQGGRLLRTAVGFAIVAAALVFGPQAAAGDGDAGAAADQPAPATALETFDTYTIGAGETLWDVAVAISAPGEDIQVVVSEIKALNGLSSANVAAGQQIVIPPRA